MNNILNELPNLYDQIIALQNILVSRATGGDSKDQDYIILRKTVLESKHSRLVPSFVRQNRDLNQFWQFIKYEYETYAERRNFISKEFHSILDAAEFEGSGMNPNLHESIEKIDSDYIDNMWKKAIERKIHDPDGAVTLSRSLIESVCKHILDHEGEQYNKNSDLSELYKKVAKLLNMSASQYENHSIFKQILGGCSGIVSGLGQLRNNVSDAHGQGVVNFRPEPRHAELAVNLAGTMSHFLLSSYHESYKKINNTLKYTNITD